MMKISLPSTALAVIATFSLPASALAAETARCVNSDQVGGLATAVLPNLVTKMSQNCANVLPEGAALRVSGAAAAEQYKDAAIAARPKAMEAIALIAGDDLPDGMSADVVFPFMEALLFAEIEKGNMQTTCPVMNNLWSAMKALPFENWGLVLAAIVSADEQSKADKANAKPSRRSMTADLPICPYIAMES
jgi:hypothetical protein